VDDLGRELDSLTSAATRGVVVPRPDEVRRRARQARRQGIGAGVASLAVVGLVVAALLQRGDSPAPQPAATSPTVVPTQAPPTRRPSPAPATPIPSTAPPTGRPTAPIIPASALLEPGQIGADWTADDPAPKPSEVRFDPCGDGKVGPKPLTQRVQRYTSESGEVVEHIISYGDDDALATMRALRNAVDRCRSATPRGGAGKVTYINRGSLGVGDDSFVLRVQGGPQDPITTYVSVVRVGSVVMTLQDTRVGEPYSEKAHRAFAQKAAARLPR
jgi:hypothetical protein